MFPRVDNRKYFAVVLLALVALAWLAIIVWGQSPYARFLDHEQLEDVSLGLSGDSAGYMLVLVVGWTVMTIAMMLPTSLPLFNLFQRVVQQRPDGTLLIALLISGYLAIWSLFGFFARWTMSSQGPRFGRPVQMLRTRVIFSSRPSLWRMIGTS